MLETYLENTIYADIDFTEWAYPQRVLPQSKVGRQGMYILRPYFLLCTC